MRYRHDTALALLAVVVVACGGGGARHQQFSISRGAMLDGTVKGTTRMRVSSPSLGEHPITMSSETESSIFLLPWA